MPHINIEYTANLLDFFDASAALQRANARIVGSGVFKAPEHVKSRAVMLPHFRAGDFDEGEAFVHARIHVIAGRNLEERKMLGQSVTEAIHSALKPPPGLRIQITAEVNEVVAETCQKILINP
jgi:5-carboxymethyl-2-hydroxymuconate isomerase